MNNTACNYSQDIVHSNPSLLSRRVCFTVASVENGVEGERDRNTYPRLINGKDPYPELRQSDPNEEIDP